MKRFFSSVFPALALACGLVLSASAASAQKALVYCPAGIDVAGCGNVAGALASAFPAGVDRGYDGSAGTVDLRTADLAGYSLVVVPSLSDNPASRPYGLLRDAEVAGRLAAVLTGRVSVWSGTPDQGRGNREFKNTLIRNLAAYAAEGAEAGIPGLLVLQDASADVSQRYGWLAGISGRTIGAERTARAFGRVRGLTEAGSRVAGGLAFANMAAFGLALPEDGGWVAEVAADDSPVTFGEAARSGTYGASLVGARVAGLVRGWWERMIAAYTVVLATSSGTSGGSARPGLTLSVSPDSVVALVAGAASANLRANLSTSGSCNAGNLANVKVNFSITPTLNQNNTSLSSGEATWSNVNLSALTPGTSYPVTATSTASGNCAANTAAGAIRVKKGTDLLDLSATGGGVGASTTLQAKLVDLSPPPGNTGVQGATVSFTIGASTVTASTVGNGTATATGTLPAEPGTYKVYVRYSGTESPGFFMAALDSTTVTVTSAAATGLAVSAATGEYGGTTGLSATLTSGGSPVAGRTVAFSLNGTAVCGGATGVACPVTSATGVASLSGVSLAGINAGAYGSGVGASFAGDGSFVASSATGPLTVGKASQAALTLSGVPASAAFNASFAVAPGGGSGTAPLVVTTSGVCSASGNSVTMTSGTGTCTVKVNRAGDDNYNAAAEVTASATATKLSQAALSLSGVPASAPFNSTFAVTAGGGSGSAPVVVTTAGVCSASGSDVTMTSGTGTCTVRVNRAGDDNYDAASEVTASAAAAKIAQAALAVTGPTAGTFGQKYAPAAVGGSGTGALSFGVGASTACTIVAAGPDAGKVEITRGTGTCDVTATKAADANFEQATSPVLAVALSRAAQAVTFAQPASPQTFGGSFAVNPTASSGLAVAVAASGGCTVAPASPGYTVTMTSGTTACVLTASQAGDDDYLAATAAAGSALERTVAAARAPATLAFSLALPAKTYGDPDFGVAGFAAAGASGIAVAFSSTTPAVCTVSAAGQVQLLKSGSCTVRAAQAASADYAAGQVDQAFAVGKRALAVEYTGDNYAATGGPTISTATIRLSATVQRTAGGTLGDLALARVRFTLTKQGGGSQTVFAMADASGNAMATANVAADSDNQWMVQTTIDPDNPYWSGDFDTDPLSVVLGTTEKRTTGGGWVADAQSANGKANFGFSVAYQKNGSPRGNLTYVYRGTDGYDYVVKSNSWQGGALTFDNRDPSLAAFSGRATVQRIDRATGLADPSWPAGNYTFTVDGMDGDLKNPKVRDPFAVTIMDNDGRIWRQVGTRTAPVQLGGGNVAVQSR